MRQVIIYPGDGECWIAECPSLPGCIADGRTREEALQNIRAEIEQYVSSFAKVRLPVPEDHFDAMIVAI